MVVHTSNPSTAEDEVGGTQVQGQPELYSKNTPPPEKNPT
jgi:hypothetical protein